MSAFVLSAALFCDYAWFVTQRAMPGPAGAYWDRRAAECRQDNGYTMMLQGERLWVFTGKPCGLEDRRQQTSHVVGREVSLGSWVLSLDAWRGRQTEILCGSQDGG